MPRPGSALPDWLASVLDPAAWRQAAQEPADLLRGIQAGGDPMAALPMGTGMVRAMPQAAGGLSMALSKGLEDVPTMLQLRPAAGKAMSVMGLKGPGRPMAESKQLGQEAMDFLRARGTDRLYFEPAVEQAGSRGTAAGRQRLFEWLLGQPASRDATGAFFPLGP